MIESPATAKVSDRSVTVVIPAYNEAEALAKSLAETIAYCQQRDWRIIVVDDGSTDATQQELEKNRGYPGLKILRHKLNRGYGGALKTGISNAATEFVVTLDADGQHRAANVDLLLETMLACDADLVIGSRTHQRQPSLYREIGKWIIRRITRFLLPMAIRDLNSGFKMYRTQTVQQYLHLCPDSMAFSDIITLIFIQQRHLVVEQLISVDERQGGKSTINTRTAFETVLEILNIIMLFNPLRIFLPVSFVCILFGVLWGFPIVLMGRGVSVGSMLAIVTGLIFFFMGLVAEQLSMIRKEGINLSGKVRTAEYQDLMEDKQ